MEGRERSSRQKVFVPNPYWHIWHKHGQSHSMFWRLIKSSQSSWLRWKKNAFNAFLKSAFNNSDFYSDSTVCLLIIYLFICLFLQCQETRPGYKGAVQRLGSGHRTKRQSGVLLMLWPLTHQYPVGKSLGSLKCFSHKNNSVGIEMISLKQLWVCFNYY